MKKLFFFCLIAAMTAMVSCSKDEDSISSKNDAVGRWEVYKWTTQNGNYIEEDNEWGERYGYRLIYDIYADGTLTIMEMDYYGGRLETEYAVTTYLIEGNQFYFFNYASDAEVMVFTIEKLTSKEFVWKGVFDSAIQRIYMKRIN